MLTIGSLFSGIGGLELGLEQTGGFKTIWQCEVDDYASAVLRKHWPNVRNLGDITKVEWDKVEKPDLICGGFPCQDISNAGKKAGIKEGTRSGLWFEFHKAICILRPKFVLIENVSELINNGGKQIIAGLAEELYDARGLSLSSGELGTSFFRERQFFLAVNNSYSFRWFAFENELKNAIKKIRETSERKSRGTVGGKIWRSHYAELYRRDNAISFGVDRIKCLGNAVVPQVAQVIGEAIIEAEGIKC